MRAPQRAYSVVRITSILALILTILSCGAPTDATLVDHFFRHERDFEKLVQMSNEDKQVVVITHEATSLQSDASWPRPESKLGFSRARWSEYRQLFDKLGLETGFSRDRDGPGILSFPFYTFGNVTGGIEKGYAYSEKELFPVVDSIDDFPPNHVESMKPIYMKLNQNWYIYYLWDG